MHVYTCRASGRAPMVADAHTHTHIIAEVYMRVGVGAVHAIGNSNDNMVANILHGTRSEDLNLAF